MEKTFYFKNLPISPKKLRFLLPGVKKRSPLSSIDYLNYLPKKGAKILTKAIKAAIDGAKNALKIDENRLKFKLLAVDEGRKLKRYRPGARGTVRPIIRRYSHLKITLEAEVEENKKKESQLEIKKNK